MYPLMWLSFLEKGGVRNDVQGDNYVGVLFQGVGSSETKQIT